MSEPTSNKQHSGEESTNRKNNTVKTAPKKRPALVRFIKALGFTLIGIIAILLITITIAVSYLKPERLTPLVEKYANEYLDAEVSIGRVEISFWSTFPKFDLDVDNLFIRSKSFDNLPSEIKTQIPEYTDSLLHIRHFNGAVNIPQLAARKIALYDIIFDSPRINIVQATPSASNIDIFPTSKEKEEKKDETGIDIPDFSIGTFEIRGSMRVRYTSLPDSTDIAVCMTKTSLKGEKSPNYEIKIEGLTNASLPALNLTHLGFGIGGTIEWRRENPYNVGLDNFNLRLGDVKAKISTKIDFSGETRVETFGLNLPLTPLSALTALIPEEMKGELSKINTDACISLSASLTHPFNIAGDSVPSFIFELEIPESKASYDRFALDRFALKAKGEIDGKNLDNSMIDLTRLMAIGEGVGFELTGIFTELLTDPSITGSFKGGLDICRLPSVILEKLPCKLSGHLRADSEFSLRRSYLDKENFHRIRLTGEATLKEFRASMPKLPGELYTRMTELRLGTNSSFTRGDISVDSLLTASLKIDTVYANVTGMEFSGKELKFGIGCLNSGFSADTTVITPIGGRIVAERIMFKSQEDSMRIRLRKSTIGATLRRYKGDARKPQLHLDIATEGAFYGDRVNRAMLSKSLLFVTVHPSAPRMSSRRNLLVDSLMNANPELDADSARVLAASIRKARRVKSHMADSIAVASGEFIDARLDNSMQKLIRQWDAKGILKAARLRIFTPYFPLRNSMSDLNMRFNSDSVIISDTHLRSGRSRLTVNGTISNISRALTSRNHRQSLKLDFNLTGDTIDVNQIAEATFAGASFAQRDSARVFIAPDTENEARLQAAVQTETDSTAIFVVPSNVEARMGIEAANIIYSDIVFHDFKGNMNVYNGAINLERMGARTDVGSVNLNALYSAPNKKDATFAFGMRVSDLHIAQVIDLVPSLDTIMPLLSDISGIINADLAATTSIDPGMNLNIPSLKAAVKLSGDSLVLIDQETFKKIGKWLLFKDKTRNVIDKMTVEMIVNNSQLELFPFIFDLDRYKLGVMGSNDMALNLHYHIAVLKSPLPFKFGINISGDVDNMKIRLGRAKFNEKRMPQTVAIADTTRINLVREIGNVFRRGVRGARMRSLDFSNIAKQHAADMDISTDTISHADSLYFIKEGLIPAPDTTTIAPQAPDKKKKQRK